MKKNIVTLFLLFLSGFSLLAQGKTALVCGVLIMGNDELPLTNKVILIEGEKIIQIGTKELISDEYHVIDLTDYTVLPGLIDVHVHPLIYGDDYQTNHLKGFNALRGLKTVQRWLNEGWTTIRIAGDADVYYAPLEIRDAINTGLFDGPRIYGAAHYYTQRKFGVT